MRGFPGESNQFYWVLISVVLSITHDNNSKVAIDRMRGNIVGSVVGLVVYFLHNPPNLLDHLHIGVVLVITVCFALDLIVVCRTALVGFVIRDDVRSRPQQLGGCDLPHGHRRPRLCCLDSASITSSRKLTSPMFQRLAAEGSPDDAAE